MRDYERIGLDSMSLTAQLPAFLKASLRKIIPGTLLRERGIIIRLGRGAGRIYARMLLLDTIGMNPTHDRLAPANARSFVFVCCGNIMRSPMADALLKKAAAEAGMDLLSDSAGLHAIPGNQAHPWAQTAASEMGISMTEHQAKLLTEEMIDQADAIFAMDMQNLAELLNSYPGLKDKIFMLSNYAGQRMNEIPDPYFGDLETTRQCYRVLQACIRNLLASRSVSQRDGTKLSHI